MPMFLRAVLLLLALTAMRSQFAHAQAAAVDVCFNYGCKQRATVTFSSADVDNLRDLLGAAADARSERILVGLAIGRMYAMAAAQSPIWRDRGRNGVDERDLEGAMDCIDHSTNASSFLRLLADHGMLRFHAASGREVRYALLVFDEHWTATVMDTATGQRYAVDSWFFDPGFPAVVVALERWKAGFDPDETAENSR